MQPKGPSHTALKSDAVYRMDIKRCNAYYISGAQKTLQNRMREQHGSARRREATSLIWMHVNETGQSNHMSLRLGPTPP